MQQNQVVPKTSFQCIQVIRDFGAFLEYAEQQADCLVVVVDDDQHCFSGTIKEATSKKISLHKAMMLAAADEASVLEAKSGKQVDFSLTEGKRSATFQEADIIKILILQNAN